jgi:hypothetical protein
MNEWASGTSLSGLAFDEVEWEVYMLGRARWFCDMCEQDLDREFS